MEENLSYYLLLVNRLDPFLLYVMDSIDDDRAQKLVVQTDFVTKKPKTKINMVRTGFKLSSDDLLAGVKGGRYQALRGALE